MSSKPALLPLPTYFWVLVIASYFSPMKSAARLAVFLREPATGTWPARAKGLIWVESEILPFAESNRIH